MRKLSVLSCFLLFAISLMISGCKKKEDISGKEQKAEVEVFAEETAIYGKLSPDRSERAKTSVTMAKNEMPEFVMLGSHIASVKKIVGSPDKVLSIPITFTSHSYEFTYYKRADLLFESINGVVFKIKMGRNSKCSVLGLKVGDSEKKLQMILKKEKPDDTQRVFISGADLPLILRSEPTVESETIYVLNRLTIILPKNWARD